MSDTDSSKLSYSSTGVDYQIMDPIKKLAQDKAKETAKNLESFGMKEAAGARGESAYVWEEEDSYKALVIEGLGTKNLVADQMYKLTGKSFYDSIAQDTVAMIVNDIIVVGAKPQVINAYFGIGGSAFLKDAKRTNDLIEGWSNACNLAGATWGGGETPTLKGIVNPETIELAGSCVGIIKPKKRLTLGEKLEKGDRILFIESNGIHANGLTLARKIAENLEQGYLKEFSNGLSYGHSILQPTHIYAKLISDLFDAGIEIHYMVNITGHGFRKLMRANKEFSYLIESLPKTQELFKFIQEKGQISDEEMYGNFNMGAGFAVFIPEAQIEQAQRICNLNNYQSWNAGVVEEGEKQVVIQPKKIIFNAESLGVR